MSQLSDKVKEGQVNEKSSLPKVIARSSRCSAQFSLCLSRNTKEWDENLGGIAQLVERLLCKQDVRSSSLLASTFLPKAWRQVLALFERGRVCSSVG